MDLREGKKQSEKECVERFLFGEDYLKMEQNNCLDKKGVDVLVHINNKEFKKFQIVNADKNQAGKIGVYSAERRKHRRKIVLFARSNKTIFKKFDNEVETTCADVVCSIREKIEKYR